MLGHPPFEFNVWLPFTNVYSSNSMRITSYEDSMSIRKVVIITLRILQKSTV